MIKDEKNNIDAEGSNTHAENENSNEEIPDTSALLPGELAPVGSVVSGVVSGIAKFGAFVDLPDKRTGLVHISQISSDYVREVSDYLQIGQKVDLYIMECEGNKIRLSIKEANTKLGNPQLSPLNMNKVSGGKAEIDKEAKLNRMMKDYQHQFDDTKRAMDSWSARNGLN